MNTTPAQGLTVALTMAHSIIFVNSSKQVPLHSVEFSYININRILSLPFNTGIDEFTKVIQLVQV